MTGPVPKKWGRRLCRAVFLILFALPLILVLPEPWIRVLPGLSPFTALGAGVADRGVFIGLWLLLPLAVAAVALFKGRFFCRWVCPFGTMISLVSTISLKRRVLKIRLGGFVFWFTVGAALVGLPLLLFLDPLSLFTNLGVLFRNHSGAWAVGVLVPLILLFALIQPLVWCTHVCPMGWMMEKMKLGKRSAEVRNRGRREALGGLLSGGALAFLFRRTVQAAPEPVLPPGAGSLDRFAATCKRCYACVRQCPTGVLTVRKRGGFAALGLPEMNFERKDGAYCEEGCGICSRVCPTGAIRLQQPEQQRMVKIGTAEVIRGDCLGWADHQWCMACDEFCPYNAIHTVTGRNGIPKPKVIAALCRGCGACQNICPAERGKAIVVRPVSVQQQARDRGD